MEISSSVFDLEAKLLLDNETAQAKKLSDQIGRAVKAVLFVNVATK